MQQQQVESTGHKRVVALAVDSSPHSENAFDFYLTNLRKDGDFLVLIHVPEAHDFSDAHNQAVIEKLMSDKAQEVLNIEKRYMGMLQEKHADLKGKFRTHGGKAGEVICRIAHEEGARIIVCGTRGQGTFRRTVMGSVSDYIVHHSDVPVLVCRYKH